MQSCRRPTQFRIWSPPWGPPAIHFRTAQAPDIVAWLGRFPSQGGWARIWPADQARAARLTMAIRSNLLAERRNPMHQAAAARPSSGGFFLLFLVYMLGGEDGCIQSQLSIPRRSARLRADWTSVSCSAEPDGRTSQDRMSFRPICVTVTGRLAARPRPRSCGTRNPLGQLNRWASPGIPSGSPTHPHASRRYQPMRGGHFRHRRRQEDLTVSGRNDTDLSHHENAGRSFFLRSSRPGGCGYLPGHPLFRSRKW